MSDAKTTEPEGPKIILVSVDKKQIEVPAKHAKMCLTIRHMLEGFSPSKQIISTPKMKILNTIPKISPRIKKNLLK